MSTEKLIADFWEGKLSLHQRQHLMEVLNDAENGLESALRKAYDDLLNVDDAPKLLSPYRAEHIFDKLDAQISAEKAKRVYLKPSWLAMAAMLLVSISIGLILLISNQKQEPAPVINTASVVKVYRNETNALKMFSLPDSSLVTLSPKSSFTTNQYFGKLTRDIYLNGKGKFEVHKDKKHPFTVYCQGVSTTALGTIFTVDGAMNNQVKVALLEGKVVVKAKNNHNGKIDSFYLLPGNVLLVDKNTSEAKYLSAENKVKPNLPNSEPNNQQGMDFKQHQLAEVFDQLAISYHVTIDYKNAQKVNKILFTGDFKRTQDLEVILNTLCTMNGLTYTRRDNQIFIKEK
ncbi:FecR family protein [Pedobacter sp. GSP4]|uniref:FecR family protein n=1 Tax=Pedobacter sp. GSP4 TaxID=3453716 RepID=UPI003EEBA1FF